MSPDNTGGAMCVLIVIGWIIAAIIWANFGWVWGLVAFVLFGLTGFGWVLVAGGIGGIWALLSPTRRRFGKAWRELGCDAKLGDEASFDDYFMEWATYNRRMGQSASAYLRARIDERFARIRAKADRILNDPDFLLNAFKSEVVRSLEDSGDVSPELLDKTREWASKKSGAANEAALADTEQVVENNDQTAEIEGREKALEAVAAQPMTLAIAWQKPHDFLSSFAVKRDGTLWAWGDNARGQLGLGDRDDRDTPTQVSTDSDWVTVVTDGASPFAVKRDGTLWAWGDNARGQLGLGDRDDRDTPTQVGTDSDWVTVVGDAASYFAIKRDGTLWAWGNNELGNLGLGDSDDRDTPTQVGSDSGWVTVATADWTSFAIRRDGTLWAWGYNPEGHLGLGDGDDRETPTQVGTGRDWLMVATGQWGATFAIKRDSTLWAWGYNGWGQLCLGDDDDRGIPTRVGNGWLTVTTDGYSSFAIRRDHTLWAWGLNERGKLGLGDCDRRDAPTRVGSDSGWVTAVVGGWASFAVRRDGTLWAWGFNPDGNLGLGDCDDREAPTQVGTDSDWA